MLSIYFPRCGGVADASSSQPVQKDNIDSDPNECQVPPAAYRRLLNWTKPDESCLVIAWLNCANNPINGNKRNGKKPFGFWSDVTNAYNSTTPINGRTSQHLRYHFQKIKINVAWFCLSWKEAKSICPCGHSDDQILEKAEAIYEEYKDGPFTFKHCWKILRDEPKWEEELDLVYSSLSTLGGYRTYFGKKLDQVKWRCPNQVAVDSMVSCEHHMHRGDDRWGKLVETQPVPQSPATAAISAALPLAATATNGSSFQNHSLHPAITGSTGGGGGARNISTPFSSSMGSSQQHMDNAASYAALGGGTAKDLSCGGVADASSSQPVQKDNIDSDPNECQVPPAAYRRLQKWTKPDEVRLVDARGTSPSTDEHNQLISESIDSSMENHWRLPPSETSPFQLGALSDLGQSTDLDFGAMASDFGAVFDECPMASDSLPGLDEYASLYDEFNWFPH